jgi:hypothetical protein
MKHFLTTLLNGRLGRCLKSAKDVLSYRVQSQSNSTAIFDVTYKSGKKQKIRISRYDLSTFDNEVDPVGTITVPVEYQGYMGTEYENKTLTAKDNEYKYLLDKLILFFNDMKINIPLKEVSIVANGNDIHLKAREKSLVFKGQLKLTNMLIINGPK